MSKKAIYLILALALPVFIFVFLRLYGKNQFDIPIYYQTEIVAGECKEIYSVPYAVPDSIVNRFEPRKRFAKVVNFDTTALAGRNLNRIVTEFSSEEVTVVDGNKISSSDFSFLRDCVFLIPKPWTAVLLDESNRIRGYYSPETREETDRLMVELKILLKKY